MNILYLIVVLLLLGWVFNIGVYGLELIIECIEERDWISITIPFAIITLSIIITWLLYHFDVLSL